MPTCKSCDQSIYLDGLCHKHYIQWETNQPIWIETTNKKSNYKKLLTCPKCNRIHDGTEFPPSLERKMKVCFLCYKKAKRIKDKEWRQNNQDRIAIYKLRAKKRLGKIKD